MRLLAFSTGFSGRDIAVDLGTANTVLSARGGELMVSEPSIVAIDTHTGASLAAGSDALALVGRDGIAALRPLKAGMIVDLPGTGELLRHLIGKMRRSGRRPRVIASVSAGVSGVQRRAVAEACMAAGACEARLVAATTAAALGSGLPVHEPTGSMVLDIGAGRSEVAMISMGAIVASRLVPGGGDEFDQRIVTHLKRAHGVLIGDHTAEQIKLQLSLPSPHGRDAPVEVLGRDIASETHTTVRLTSEEIRGVLDRPVTRIIEATKETLALTPPQLACDVIDRGITLTGGCSLLHRLAERLRLEMGIPVRVADSPCTRIAVGLARMVESHPTGSRSAVRPAIAGTTATAAN